MVVSFEKNPHVLLKRAKWPEITLIHRRDYRASARKEASDLVAPLRSIFETSKALQPAAQGSTSARSG